MSRLFLNKQFFYFVFSGGTAAVVNFSSRYLFEIWFSFSLSIIFAYCCGMVTAYFLNIFFVFKDSTLKLTKSIIFFVLVNILAVLQTWVISITLANYFLPYMGVTKFVHEIAHGIGIIVPVFTSFIGHKYFTFK